MLIVLPEIKDNSLILFVKTLINTINPLTHKKMDLDSEDLVLLNLMILNFFIANNISNISINDMRTSQKESLITVVNTDSRVMKININNNNLIFDYNSCIGVLSINNIELFIYHNNIYVHVR